MAYSAQLCFRRVFLSGLWPQTVWSLAANALVFGRSRLGLWPQRYLNRRLGTNIFAYTMDYFSLSLSPFFFRRAHHATSILALLNQLERNVPVCGPESTRLLNFSSPYCCVCVPP